jgi:hypothetical protein
MMWMAIDDPLLDVYARSGKTEGFVGAREEADRRLP